MEINSYLLIGDTLDEISIAVLKSQTRPDFILKKEVPSDLTELTYEQLQILKECKTEYELFENGMLFLMGLEINKQILELDVCIMFGFVNFIVSEIQKINKAFSNLRSEPSMEELKAGVEQLDLGYIGTLDYYAKRQGLTSYRDAEKVKWIDFYSVMEIDKKVNDYKQRLRDVYAKK